MPGTKKIAVIGVGNVLLSDEGLGVRAVERMSESGVPENVKLVDAGTALQRVLSAFEGFDKIIIVDAVKAGKAAGTIYRFTLSELEEGKNNVFQYLLSLHEMDVPKTIAMERLVVELPEDIVVIGMEPESISPGMELSAAVEARMKELISKIREEIGD